MRSASWGVHSVSQLRFKACGLDPFISLGRAYPGVAQCVAVYAPSEDAVAPSHWLLSVTCSCGANHPHPCPSGECWIGEELEADALHKVNMGRVTAASTESNVEEKRQQQNHEVHIGPGE